MAVWQNSIKIVIIGKMLLPLIICPTKLLAKSYQYLGRNVLLLLVMQIIIVTRPNYCS